MTKVFCIGLNKTGTTSLGDALQTLGMSRSGWSLQAAEFTLCWHEKRFPDEIVQVVEKYDCFEDLPWPLYFEELDKRNPDARFILTTRKTDDAWLRSIQGHIERIENWVGHFLIYGSYDPESDAKKYMKKYQEHNAAVRAYFSSKPDRLLDIHIEEANWLTLCEFLGCPCPDLPFPHSNKGTPA